jgi:peptide/nickel transport system ATP-binding protein
MARTAVGGRQAAGQFETQQLPGLVGESGCGKSTVAPQLLGFRHAGIRTDSGRILLDGAGVLALDRPGLDRLRGAKVSFVPQNPTALNPGMRVGAQIDEILTAHGLPAGERTRELLGLVGLPDAAGFLRRYPHQLSGGQQQRVCIAMALDCNPGFVVLDEPTTGLDVTTQEQIVDLLIGLRARLGMSMLYVTHDLGLLSQISFKLLCGLVVMSHDRRRILHLSAAAHPSAEWIAQQLTEAVG